MCMACYGAGAPPMRAAPVPVPTAQRAPVVQFNNPYAQGWTCYPSRTGVQYVPPPPAPARARRCNPAAPPGMVSGASYVFPLKHTYVHVIMGTKVWEPNHGKFNFKMKRVPTSLSIKEFLDAITCGGGSGMACTEVVELGGGCWSKGTTVKYSDDKKAANSMESYGWNEKRGASGGRPPVWLVIHEA